MVPRGSSFARILCDNSNVGDMQPLEFLQKQPISYLLDSQYTYSWVPRGRSFARILCENSNVGDMQPLAFQVRVS